MIGVGIVGFVIYVALIVFVIAGMWKTFVKAGQPGWACLIPFYNLYILTQIAGKPKWFILLFFIPLVNIYAAVVTMHGISVKFGQGVGFTIGLLLLAFIFYPILGFGDAQYDAART
jgi:hypothetical protein